MLRSDKNVLELQTLPALRTEGMLKANLVKNALLWKLSFSSNPCSGFKESLLLWYSISLAEYSPAKLWNQNEWLRRRKRTHVRSKRYPITTSLFSNIVFDDFSREQLELRECRSIYSHISLALLCEGVLALLQQFNKLLPHSIGVKFRHFVTHPAALILRTHLTLHPPSPADTCSVGWLSTVRDRAAIQHVRQFNWPHQHHPTTAVWIRNPYGILQQTPSLPQNFTVNIILPGVKIATRRGLELLARKTNYGVLGWKENIDSSHLSSTIFSVWKAHWDLVKMGFWREEKLGKKEWSYTFPSVVPTLLKMHGYVLYIGAPTKNTLF